MYLIYDCEGTCIGTISQSGIDTTTICEVLEHADFRVRPVEQAGESWEYDE